MLGGSHLSKRHRVQPIMSKIPVISTTKVEAPLKDRAPHGTTVSHGTPRYVTTARNMDISRLNSGLLSVGVKIPCSSHCILSGCGIRSWALRVK